MPKRIIMTCQTRPLDKELQFGARHPVASDANTFGALLLDAYLGTVDYEGEDLERSIETAKGFLRGDELTPILEASFATLENGRMRAISFITNFEGAPLLAVTATEKESQRTGLASELIQRSLDALAFLGSPSVRLFVTATNSPAIAVYEKLGFAPEQT